MKRTFFIGILVGIAVLGAEWKAHSQTAKPARPLRMEKVKGDLYMISGEGGNVAVYVTSEGVILVDDMFEPNYDQIVALVKSVTTQPVNT